MLSGFIVQDEGINDFNRAVRLTVRKILGKERGAPEFCGRGKDCRVVV